MTLNQENDIEALARQNEQGGYKDPNDGETDIIPQNQPSPTSPNNQIQMPILPAAGPQIQNASTNQTQQNFSTSVLSVNYKIYFALIGVQFIFVSSVVFAGLVYAGVNIQWG